MTKIIPTIHRMLPDIVEQAKADALPKRPRWKRPIRNQAAYDKAVRLNAKLQAENPRPPWQSEMRRQLGLAKGTALARKRAEPRRRARERAELEAETAIRNAVAALELVLHGLNACPAPKTYDKRVNQMQIHNAVVYLKTKCGVKFEDDEFSHHAALDRAQFKMEEGS